MKPLLLDTHALLWWLTGDERLPDAVRTLIEDAENVVFASAVSAWEVSIKAALGKLDAPPGLVAAAEETGLAWLPIEPAEAYEAGQLPMHHRDPFDRLLVAQALARSLVLVSRDEVLDRYRTKRIW